MATNANYNTDRKFEIMTGEEFLKDKKYWPVTYIMKSTNGNKMYIGITRDFESRMKQHELDENKKDLKNKWVISHTQANESITYYLESFLIHYGRMNDKVKNINTKVQSGELFKRDSFHKRHETVLESIQLYNELCEMGIFTNSLDELKEHAFAKLNPDLGFTNKQLKIIDYSIELINKGETFYIEGPAGTGKTAILIKIINDYKLVNEDNEDRKIIGVYSASVQNRNTIKKYVQLINTDDEIIYFDKLSDVEKWISSSNQSKLHLLVDEAQVLSKETYGSKIHRKHNLKSELEWIKKNINSYTLLFDSDQSDFYSDIDIKNELDEDKVLLELKEQFRIKADKHIFHFFKEFLGLEKQTSKKFDTYEYTVEVVESIHEGINKIKLIDSITYEGNARILNPGYNKKDKKEGIDKVKMLVDNADRSKDLSKLPIEKIQNSKRMKGLSIDNSLVIIGKEISMRDGELIIDPSLWQSNVIQELSYEEQVQKIKSTYYVLLTRASRNLIVYIDDLELRQHFKTIVEKRLTKRTRIETLFDENIIN